MSIRKDLLDSVGSPSREALEDIIRKGIDTIEGWTENDVIQAIPVFGAIIRVYNGVIDFRDRLYLQKIARFLLETNKISDNERKMLTYKIADNPKEAEKAGEAILEILNQISQGEKASMLARVFRAYINENLDFEYFLLLAEMVERLYVADLIGLVEGRSYSNQNLISAGVMELYSMDDIYRAVNKGMGHALSTGGAGHVNFNPRFTKHGSDLRRVLKEYA